MPVQKIVKFVNKTAVKGVVNGLLEAKGLGLGAALYSSGLNEWQDANIIEGNEYNPADGHWYERGIFFNELIRIPVEEEPRLNELRRSFEQANQIENRREDNSSLMDDLGKLYEQLDTPEERDSFLNHLKYLYSGSDMDLAIRKGFNDLLKFVTPAFLMPRIDPLTLDLDGDGFETTGATDSGVYFDLANNGIKVRTGWISPDDGLLALDRNGNGTIDSGAELFGDATPLAGGGLALDGLHALAGQDSNSDGYVDALDANWSVMKVWRDMNQDGISQSAELTSLAANNIALLSTARLVNSEVLENGNRIADLGSFTRTDGGSGLIGVVGAPAPNGEIADIDLGFDGFYREFSDLPPILNEVRILPGLDGSGILRDLREAASIDSTAGATLRAILTQYSAATTKNVQVLLIDQLVNAWVATAGVEFGSLISAVAGRVDTYHKLALSPADERLVLLASAFNGFSSDFASSIIREVPTHFVTARDAQGTVTHVSIYYDIGLYPGQREALQRIVDAVKTSVYDGLLSQTRLKSALDAIIMYVDNGNVTFDLSGMDQIFRDKIAADGAAGMIDLVDYIRIEAKTLGGITWSGALPLVEELLPTIVVTPTLAELFLSLGYAVGSGQNDTISGSSTQGNSIVLALSGNDTIIDTAGSDTIDGGDGDDTISDSGTGTNTLRGGAGNDSITYAYNSSNTIEGGAGNDTLASNSFGTSASLPFANTFAGGTGTDRIMGGHSTDTYLFNRGDGADTIVEYGTSDRTDKIVFGAGIAAADIKVSRSGTNLVLTVTDPANPGATDSITIESWLSSDLYTIEQLVFADGTTTSKAQLVATMNAMVGTAAADTLSGWTDNNSILGMGGNDTISDGGGNDTIDGGDGNDAISDTAGSDTIDGGAGDDTISDSGTGTNTLRGGAGNDSITYAYNSSNTIEGGAGNDTLASNSFGTSASLPFANTFAGGTGTDRIMGGHSTDTYLFNRGDGADTIVEYGSADRTDKIVFGAGIAKTDLSVARSGNNLVVTIGNSLGLTGESVTVENWFSSTVYEVEQFVLNDGTILTGTQVVGLIGIPPA